MIRHALGSTGGRACGQDPNLEAAAQCGAAVCARSAGRRVRARCCSDRGWGISAGNVAQIDLAAGQGGAAGRAPRAQCAESEALPAIIHAPGDGDRQRSSRSRIRHIIAADGSAATRDGCARVIAGVQRGVQARVPVNSSGCSSALFSVWVGFSGGKRRTPADTLASAVVRFGPGSGAGG